MGARTEFLAVPARPEAPPVDLGDPLAELRAAREEVAVGWHLRRGAFRIGGSDRHDFLHRMLTATVRPGERGTGTRTLLLDDKGRVLADIDLLEEADRLLGLTGAEAVETVLSALGRYVLRSEVTLEPRATHVLAVVGPGAEGLVAGAGIEIPDGEAPCSAPGRLGEADVRCVRTARLPDGLEIVARAEASGGVASALLDAGAVAVGSDALETLRVEAGIPGHGSELTGGEFPQEAGLERWVDFEKGCYLGQETVARIHYRGQVNRLLCRLRHEDPVEVGWSLVRGDRQAGLITSVAPGAAGGSMALGYVRREIAEEGGRLETEPGSVAVTVLPSTPDRPDR